MSVMNSNSIYQSLKPSGYIYANWDGKEDDVFEAMYIDMLPNSSNPRNSHHTCWQEEGLKPYTIEDIAQVLEDLKLDKYVQTFTEQVVDGELAFDFDESILQDHFKFSRFDALKFMKFVKTGHIPS
jgi:hypothetical protein